jgi:MFS transporter, FSR family, fosmidomycin resistance protein
MNPKEAMDRPSVAMLSAGHLCIDLCQGAVPALLPFLLIQRHLSYTAAAGLVLATSIASSVIQPVFGRFSDRFSAPWLMPAGLLMAGVGLALASFAPTYWLIAFSVAFAGVGVAAFHPEAARLMYGAAGKERATGMSLFSIGGNLGFALGPLVTTALLITVGLEGTTLLIVPIAIISLVLIGSFRRFWPYHSGSKREGAMTDIRQPDAWGPFTRLTVIVMCRSIIFYGFNTFLPLYWVIALHQSNAAGGIALTVLLGAGVIGTLIGGRMADRYGRRIVVLIGMGILMPLALAFVALSTINLSIAQFVLVLVGLALFAPASVMVVMGQEYIPNHIGTASGVTLGLAVSVGGITVPLFGRIADLYGIHTALVALACIPLLALGMALTLPGSRIVA